MTSTLPPPSTRIPLASRLTPKGWAIVAVAITCANYVLLGLAFDRTLASGFAGLAVWGGLCALFPAQFVAASFVFSKKAARGSSKRLVPGVFAVVAMLGNVAVGGLAAFAMLFAAFGGGWGRPLRVKGRQTHADLDEGPDWAKGDPPDVSDLDAPTRRALEALWLHDAQKEHASVPAFSRVSWLLAAVGAPPELLRWSHRAAIEEIAHARLCFALAAGYGGRSHTVRPMPELLGGDLGITGDPIAVLLSESLGDGCLLEDFNADIAGECALVCQEPRTRAVLDRITREERSHADFSWAVVEWLVASSGEAGTTALARAIDALDAYRRPTAVSRAKLRIVAQADPEQLRRHGRLPDRRWAELWRERLAATKERARALIAEPSLC